MILAGRRLRIHHGNQWCAFAEFPGKFVRTFAHVIVDAVDANATILTHVILAVVNVFGAVGATIAGCAFTRVVCEVVDAFGIIFARIEVGTVRNFRLAIFAAESGWAFACVRLDTVDTRGIVLALVLAAIIDIHFAPGTGVASHAAATEPSFFEYGAGGIVAAWIAVARVDHEFAVFAMETGFAHAIVLAFGLRLAHGIILAWERVAGVAFR